MPLTIIDKSFSDLNNELFGFYTCNAGDPIKIQFKILERIFVITGSTNIVQVDLFNDTLTWLNGNWLLEGFIVGDNPLVRKFSQTGTQIGADTGQIISISGANFNVMQLSAGSLTSNSIVNVANLEYLVISQPPFNTPRAKEIIITTNHSLNSSGGSQYSLIDGETTAFKFDFSAVSNYPNFPNGTIVNGLQIGANKSGQFNTNCKITFSNETPTNAGFEGIAGYIYFLEINVINSGAYDSAWFNFTDCLKQNIRIESARAVGQPFNRNLFVINDQANTGWFNEPFNIGLPQSTLTSGCSGFSFDAVSSSSCIINMPIPISLNKVGVGACFIPLNDTYYKNKPENQSKLTMFLPTTSQVFLGAGVMSYEYSLGAGYILSGTGSIVGNNLTMNINISPNPAFTSFMDAQDDGDRLFYVWVKVGNVNHLVFADQLISNPPPPDPLTLEQHIIFDHSENVTTSSITESGYNANVEDDLAFTGVMLFDLGQIYDSISAKIVSLDSSNNQEFTLENCLFNLSSIPLVNNILAINNLTQPIIQSLPTTSEKRNAILSRDSAYDSGNQYGVRIYFPFLYRWEYWLPQNNASNDFLPNKNKDWVQYGTTGNWSLNVKIDLKKNGISNVFYDKISIMDYDSSTNIQETFKLEYSGSPVTSVISGAMHLLTITCEKLDGANFLPNTWIEVSVEPFESATRWICSSVVPTDNNSNNPLSDFGYNPLLQLTFVTPSVIGVKLNFDASLIDTTNGVKFTCKVKDK